MAFAPRTLAPIDAPDPPKPPQINIVTSALMPDVDTDTLDPESSNILASAGWDASIAKSGRRKRTKPSGDTVYRELIEKRNALIASIASMSDIETQQEESGAGLTPTSVPSSIYPSTASTDTRWTGGFAYAPENQYRAILNDWAGQAADLPYMRGNGQAAPTGASATPSNTGGVLTNAASPYAYLLAGIYADGSITVPTAAQTATIASGSTGSVALAWTNAAGSIGTAIFGRFAGSYKLLGTVAIGTTTFTDAGAASPALAASLPPLGNLPLVGYVPFLIQVMDQMSAIGYEQRDFVGRALRLLDFVTPSAIERELWSGGFAQNAYGGPVYQADFPTGLNAFFTQTGTPSQGGSSLVPQDLTPGAGPPSIARGMQILEDYLANSGGGGQGMIHVAPQTSPNLLGARRVGALLLSVLDNIIVPGSGYPTSGAQGPIGNGNVNASSTTGWMFATDLVSVRLDKPVVTPGTLAEALDRGYDGEPNMIRFRAQRFAAATWDGARLGAVRVTLAS